MRIDVVRPQELTRRHWLSWAELRGSDRAYASPFYAPEFFLASERSRPVYVAVIEDGGRFVGFLPFERRARGLIVPVGQHFSDHHGPIVAPGSELPMAKILRAAGASRYWFNGAPAHVQPLHPYHESTAVSPIVEVVKVGKFSQQRKLNLLAREVGPVRFTRHEPNRSDLLDLLIRWKRAQYVRTNVPDALEFGANGTNGQLVRDLLDCDTPNLRTWLSVLWAGDRPVAIHFGLLSQRAWHWCYPAYDVELARYSPGLILMHSIFAAAKEAGIEWVDFGHDHHGTEAFKWEYKNAEIPIAVGMASTPLAGAALSAKRALERAARGVASWVRKSGGERSPSATPAAPLA